MERCALQAYSDAVLVHPRGLRLPRAVGFTGLAGGGNGRLNPQPVAPHNGFSLPPRTGTSVTPANPSGKGHEKDRPHPESPGTDWLQSAMGRRPHRNRGNGVIPFHDESVASYNYSASFVRRRRVLLWGTCVRRRRGWPDSGDMPGHIFHGRIAHKTLTAYGLQEAKAVAQSAGRNGWLTPFRWPARNNPGYARRNPCLRTVAVLIASIRRYIFGGCPFNQLRFAEAVEKSCRDLMPFATRPMI